MSDICKLCRESGDLCRSHVIPEWGYAGAYDESHTFVAFDLLNQGKRKRKIRQKGEWEKLLCRGCETRFSVWENYGKRIWDLETGQWEELKGGGLRGTGLDYRRLKLFLLSILWRADVATGDIGENVSLGLHSEKIRLRLLEDDPQEPLLYPCMMMRIFEGETWKQVGLRWPITGRWDGQRAYSVAFKGLGLLYVIGNKALKPEQQRGCVDTDGHIVMGTSQAVGWSGPMKKLEISWPSESALPKDDEDRIQARGY